jgi:hypothetical protein
MTTNSFIDKFNDIINFPIINSLWMIVLILRFILYKNKYLKIDYKFLTSWAWTFQLIVFLLSYTYKLSPKLKKVNTYLYLNSYNLTLFVYIGSLAFSYSNPNDIVKYKGAFVVGDHLFHSLPLIFILKSKGGIIDNNLHVHFIGRTILFVFILIIYMIFNKPKIIYFKNIKYVTRNRIILASIVSILFCDRLNYETNILNKC